MEEATFRFRFTPYLVCFPLLHQDQKLFYLWRSFSPLSGKRDVPAFSDFRPLARWERSIFPLRW